MKDDTWQLLERDFVRFPILRAEPVTPEEVDEASAAVGLPFPADYREFLLRYGGAVVGPFPILGLRKAYVMGEGAWNVVEVNRGYREDGYPGINQWLLISIDQAGNPFGIAPDGRVWVSDHDFGQTEVVADSFEEFLRRRCLEVE